MRFNLFAAAVCTTLLAGCASDGPYYGGYGYDYDYGYYGPSSYYGPSYHSFYYRHGDRDHRHGHWMGPQSWQQGSVQTRPRSTATSQPSFRSGSNLAHGGRHVERHERVARQPDRMASAQRHVPEHNRGG